MRTTGNRVCGYILNTVLAVGLCLQAANAGEGSETKSSDNVPAPSTVGTVAESPTPAIGCQKDSAGPCPLVFEPRQFVIFFGNNKCNITAEADAVLSEAAAVVRSSDASRIEITGHAERAEDNGRISRSYAQRLSECRANTAKTNLVGKGVPEDKIFAVGKGDQEPLVVTTGRRGDPQNRRAELEIR